MQKRQKLPKTDQMRRALDEIGGEPLAGSGFENDKPEEGFSGAVPGPVIYLRASPRGSH